MAPESHRGTTSTRVWQDIVITAVALVALVVLLTANSLTSRSSVVPTATEVQAPVVTVPDIPPRCSKDSSTPLRSAPVADRAAKTVALTFDDGPGPWTGRILDILRDQDVRATFFVVGGMVATRPEAVKRIHAEGHAIGNHTWSHRIPDGTEGWRPSSLAREIERTQSAVGAVVGVRPCYFRPPGGVVKGARRVSQAKDLSMVLWSVDTRDWAGTSAATIRKRARAGLKQRHPVILLHDGGSSRSRTARALVGIIADYKAEGYEFVTF